MHGLRAASAIAIVAALAAHADAAVVNAACGKQWTIVDVDNDGIVTNEEARKAIDEEYARLDANADAVVDPEELRACRDQEMSSVISAEAGAQPQVGEQAAQPAGGQQASGAAPWTAEAAPLAEGFRIDMAADLDKSGTLDRMEYARAAEEDYRARAARDPKLPMGSHARVMSVIFTSLDRNGDGEIGEAELARAPWVGPDPDFAAADENGDGALSPDEWTAWRVKNDPAAGQQSGQVGAAKPTGAGQIEGGVPGDQGGVAVAGGAPPLFPTFDIDRSGQITPDEWMSWHDGRRALVVFAAMDKDSDQRVSREEYAAFLDGRLREAGQRAGEGKPLGLHPYLVIIR